MRYRVSRKVESRPGPVTLAASAAGHHANEDDEDDEQLPHGPLLVAIMSSSSRLATPPIGFLAAGVNIWQMRPETVWWDSKLRSLRPGSGQSSREETRLLMVFLDVIHPITHTFYKLDQSVDRSWMLQRLLGAESVYYSALSISACFEHSLTQRPKVDEIGISPTVRRLQNESICRLRDEVDRFAAMDTAPVEDFVWAGVQVLDVIAHLETLEIFSMLQGQWEMHHQAARKVLNYMESRVRRKDGNSTSIIVDMLQRLPAQDAKRRSLTFCLLNYIWIDVLATCTFGAMSYCPCAFDYIHLLDTETFRPQDIMGCQGWVLSTMASISRLEKWRLTHASNLCQVNTKTELQWRRSKLEKVLDDGIDMLQRDGCHSDGDMITLVWAYGAKVLCQVTTAPTLVSQFGIEQTFVNLCLEKLESLPTRLVMRTSWPYTIAGSMALSEAQHHRFRWIVGKTLQDAQPPGISWKGLMVMEECWRLRGNRQQFVGWREAMSSLGARVILT